MDRGTSAAGTCGPKNMSMEKQIFLLALCASAFAGCDKKEVAISPELTAEQAARIESEYLLPTNDAAESAPANPGDPAPAPGAGTQRVKLVAQPAVKPIQQRLQGAVHAQLTLQLRMFIEKNSRVPESFSEFVNSAMDTVPPAPDGMKFIIDPTDRTVKAVKK